MINFDEKYKKGNSFTLEGDLNQDITNWKIRTEIYDKCGNSIKLATANAGGSDNQIEITNTTEGKFLIKVESDKTTNFEDNGFIEIEVETTTIIGSKNEKTTVLQAKLNFVTKQINWESPS